MEVLYISVALDITYTQGGNILGTQGASVDSFKLNNGKNNEWKTHARYKAHKKYI